jgi:hypothetical protein
MWDAWAAYGIRAGGVLTHEHHRATTRSARDEAISYAAYRLLSWRFAHSFRRSDPAVVRRPDGELGYDPPLRQPRRFSCRGGQSHWQACIDFGLQDGSNEINGYANFTKPMNPRCWPRHCGNPEIRPESLAPLRWRPSSTSQAARSGRRTVFTGPRVGQCHPVLTHRGRPEDL